MGTKFNLSTICKQAWFEARCIARDTKVSVRSALGEGFRRAWRLAKGAIALRPTVIAREDQATRSQLAYITSLSKRPAPIGLTKRAASAMIDRLIVLRANPDAMFSALDADMFRVS